MSTTKMVGVSVVHATDTGKEKASELVVITTDIRETSGLIINKVRRFLTISSDFFTV
jgi:hypothetical protein